jgi:hypothetical protein
LASIISLDFSSKRNESCLNSIFIDYLWASEYLHVLASVFLQLSAIASLSRLFFLSLSNFGIHLIFFVFQSFLSSSVTFSHGLHWFFPIYLHKSWLFLFLMIPISLLFPSLFAYKALKAVFLVNCYKFLSFQAYR